MMVARNEGVLGNGNIVTHYVTLSREMAGVWVRVIKRRRNAVLLLRFPQNYRRLWFVLFPQGEAFAYILFDHFGRFFDRIGNKD